MRAERPRSNPIPVTLALLMSFLALWAVAPGPEAKAAPLLTAAGDIACGPDSRGFNHGRGTRGRCRQLATSRLLPGADRIMALGDIQSTHTNARNLRRGYHPTWGRYRQITRSVIGNHEYGPPQHPHRGARDYWRYFGERRAGPKGKGWYSFNLGRWHVVALNSLCRESHRPRLMQRKVGCGEGSQQLRWLRHDLAQNRRKCILAAWHHPRFASGSDDWHPVSRFWGALQRAGADVVLSGHAHNYERFRRQAADGSRSARGLRQFIVGTGGASLAAPPTSTQANSQKLLRRFGVLRLRLKANSYRWKFVGVRGERTLDHGASSCR